MSDQIELLYTAAVHNPTQVCTCADSSTPFQAQELSEAHVKIGLLEKKVESIDTEIARHVGAEKEETNKMKQALEKQERSVLWVYG